MTAGSPPLAAPSAAAELPKLVLRWRWRGPLVGVVLALLLVAGVAVELRTSAFEAALLPRLAEEMSWAVAPGPSERVAFPASGPLDERFGYVALPGFIARLAGRGFAVESQAVASPGLARAAALGISPPYREKSAAGLRVLDPSGAVLYANQEPRWQYESLEDVPKLVLDSLLYVENRELLSPAARTRNPAVEWDRFALASLQLASRAAGADGAVAGGSTLATQMEKYRHSPHGLTGSPVEKLRQLASASLRAYRLGPDTGAVRGEIALDYLNSVPLAAAPGRGEVFGLGDALGAWYGTDPARVNALLRIATDPPEPAFAAARALAYKQALSLILSARRPSALLRSDRDVLDAFTDSYLRRMAADGIITRELRDAALAQVLVRRASPLPPAPPSGGKGTHRLRSALATTLGLPDLYALGRLDLTVEATLDQRAQQAVSERLAGLTSPSRAAEAGLLGKGLLESPEAASEVVLAFSLYERTPGGNVLRVHADNLGQAFDVNEGIKLDLGSTAKLRTLAGYLEVVAELHERWAPLPPETRAAALTAARDPITRFVLEELAAKPDLALAPLLDAALERKFSASPYESFFTGGGLHRFANFDEDDDDRILTLKESFRRSVNLPFVRLMRELVRYELAQDPERAAELADPASPARRQALERFAENEARMLLARHQRQYAGLAREEVLTKLVSRRKPTPTRVATILLSLEPEASRAWFDAQLLRLSPEARRLPQKQLARLHQSLSPRALGLADRAWLARVAPLELWTAAYLWHHPAASREDVLAASTTARAEANAWLFATKNRRAQDRRLRTVAEREAFARIHARWQRLGYPFPSLVPSYASAIGTSADRPAALAELMGILLADGVRLPSARLTRLRFAQGTPYETNLVPAHRMPERVMRVEVAQALRGALLDVVANGTGRRANGAFVAGGVPLPIGGKTGTGDHRVKTFARGGRLLEARAVDRTATFAFLAGDRWFGVMTAYVSGDAAERYRFTSALPQQVLKALGPALEPLLSRDAAPPTLAATETRVAAR
jgi:membrane peptidoglycan carboxypeptidase